MSIADRVIADAIKAARVKLGWTQEDLASKSTVRRATLGSVESGKYTVGAETLFKLTSALGISSDEIQEKILRIESKILEIEDSEIKQMLLDYCNASYGEPDE